MALVQGVYTGVVVDTIDPLGRGRVRLQVPQLAGLAVTTWASPGAHGAVEVGDRVSVAFDGSDRNYPIYWPARPEQPALVWTDITGIASKYTASPGTGWLQPQWARGTDGTVHVRGLLFASSSIADADTLFSLPWPPPNGLIFPVAGSSTSSLLVQVTSSGGTALFKIHNTPSPAQTWLSFGRLSYSPA